MTLAPGDPFPDFELPNYAGNARPPDVTAALRAGLGARRTFLCDAQRAVQVELALREKTDTKHHPYVPRISCSRPTA